MSKGNDFAEGMEQVSFTQGETNSEAISQERRQALAKIAKAVSYSAPATLALLSMDAKACSLTC